MTSKFQRGHRVKILSRRLFLNDPSAWENSGVGEEAIVIRRCCLCSNVDIDVNKETTYNIYDLLIFRQSDSSYAATLQWYEEPDLELICSNTEKGVRLISHLHFDYFKGMMIKENDIEIQTRI